MINNPNFSLDLGHPWRQLETGDPEQYNFHDDDRDILIVLSSITHPGIAEDDLDHFAELFAGMRLRAEADAASIFDSPVTFYEPIIVRQPWGRALAYYGHDATGRQFGYSGSITRNCTINLYMQSNTLSERELFEAMDEVFSKIEFDRTPLDTAPHIH